MSIFKDGLIVNIIESPSAMDLRQGRSEGKMLTAALDLVGLPHSYSLVGNYTEFMDALGRKLVLGADKHKRLPSLHLSMHGSTDGVQLTDGKLLTWADLNWKLRLINSKLKHTLVVCLSSCYGLSGAVMIRSETIKGSLKENAPFRLFVSNLDAVTWSDAATAFATFYHHLAKGTDMLDLVRVMRVASGNDAFFGLFAGEKAGEVGVLGTTEVKKSIERGS